MSQDDPFLTTENADRTVLRPTPGGRRPPGTAPAYPTPSAMGGAGDALPWSDLRQLGSGLNPLVRCASPLLVTAAQLRHTPSHGDPDGLRNRLVGQIREFESCARAQGIPEATVLPARYVLCSLIDEGVLGTPWGSESTWAKQGLLITFHKETWGGEKFFHALERLIAYPSGNLHMLELMYLCLALGFEGRYRVREGGRDQLEAVRERLFQTIRAQRGDAEPEISPHWRGVTEPRDPLTHTVPLWVLAAVATALLLVLFTLLNLSLNRESEPVFQRIASLDVPVTEIPRTPAPEPPQETRPAPRAELLTLRKLLKDDIRAGKLEVVDQIGGETIRIRGDGLFPSGKVSVKDEYIPVLTRIGEALDQLPGTILITGHTDSVPIRSRRFASNQQLSEERAVRVREELQTKIRDVGRITTRGRGAAEPVIEDAPTDARNRRVEITLWRTGHTDEATQ